MIGKITPHTYLKKMFRWDETYTNQTQSNISQNIEYDDKFLKIALQIMKH